jgi:hypothetical protein
MDVTRSVNALRVISRGLKVIAWIVGIAFAAAAIKLAFSVSFIPADLPTSVEAMLPGNAFLAGVLLLVLGAANWLVLLGLAEGINLVIAIEENTRAAAAAKEAAAPANAGVA